MNGEDLKCSTHLQAMQAIWNSGPRIKLSIRRKLSATNDSFNTLILLKWLVYVMIRPEPCILQGIELISAMCLHLKMSLEDNVRLAAFKEMH